MKQCLFCSQNIKEIDYKQVDLLKKFISSQGKIINPKYTDICPKHQRKLAKAIKRARYLGLLSYTEK